MAPTSHPRKLGVNFSGILVLICVGAGYVFAAGGRLNHYTKELATLLGPALAANGLPWYGGQPARSHLANTVRTKIKMPPAVFVPVQSKDLGIGKLFVSAQTSAQSGLKSSATSKPQIMVLGVFHLVSTSNMFTQKQGDTLTPKRQQEIREVVERLKAFHPTKIAVEHDYDGRLNERYQQYLADKYALGAEETDQFAFRLGKEIGLSHIDSIYYPVSFDPQKAEAYANSHDQKAVWDAALGGAHMLIEQLDNVLTHGSMLEALRFFNSESAIDLNSSIYLVRDRIGDGNEYPGSDAVGGWYGSNLHIFANLVRLITSPEDRVLVIYGQGHANLLRSFIKGSPDLQFVDPLTVLK